jgi:hypothetical protein
MRLYSDRPDLIHGAFNDAKQRRGHKQEEDKADQSGDPVLINTPDVPQRLPDLICVILLSSKILDNRSNNRVTKVRLSIKYPNSRMRMIRIGGSAKFVKKAVAPARRSGSFFWKSLNAVLNWSTNFSIFGNIVCSITLRAFVSRK